MKILTVVGTRPEFVQVAPLTRAIRARHEEVLVHTGQHYDADMSDVFFSELELPPPERHLAVGSGGHGEQTGRLLIELERVLLEERPAWVIVFGDTNSTVAAALAAAKLHTPIAHVEAGLRSYDRRMPEELNRIVADHTANLLLAPTERAVRNLADEGLRRGVEHVGDVRIDLLERSRVRALPRQAELVRRLGLEPGRPFALATIHRASNTDDETRLSAILAAFGRLSLPVVLAVHPRLAKMTREYGLALPPNVRAVAPLGFLDLLATLDASRLVITDSGGLQKEAYILGKPGVTLRDTTEWIETVESGWNRLCEPEALETAVGLALDEPPLERPAFYGTPGVCERIVDLLERGVPSGAEART